MLPHQEPPPPVLTRSTTHQHTPHPAHQPTPPSALLNLRAARQYRAREGHLNIPRKHIEQLEDTVGQVVAVKIGTWTDNVRKRAAKLSAQRRADLDALGMRW
ncbi:MULTISPECIES: helicase associated domain-containing protein [Streptomyces]|uniref:helicase associated domain-containing protein n=1 Tax=Streptomyces TaxID=1883 RepID=UPI00345C4AE2